MKVLLLSVICLVSLAQARRDHYSYIPDEIVVIPERPPPLNLKITNGVEATPHSYPHACALYINGRSFCGCSVLNATLILTAAHCVDSATTVEVVTGAHNLISNEPSQQRVISKKFVVHEEWDRNNLINDIALVVLPKSLNLTGSTVAPVKLDTGSCLGNELDGRSATVVGWGKPSDSASSISHVLRNVTNPLLSNQECRSYFSIIQGTHICLNGSGGRSSCNGDSGGSLLSTRPNQTEVVQVGIVSFGSGWGCSIGFPSAYTRVACFTSWIKLKMIEI